MGLRVGKVVSTTQILTLKYQFSTFTLEPDNLHALKQNMYIRV